MVGPDHRMPAPRTITARREIADQAKRVMLRRLAEPGLTLDDVAREVCVSKRQLQRAFAAVGTEGFLHELSRLRVIVAARMLEADPTLTITDVVGRVGMRHRSNFARLFRQHLGENPQTWRARQRAVTPGRLAA